MLSIYQDASVAVNCTHRIKQLKHKHSIKSQHHTIESKVGKNQERMKRNKLLLREIIIANKYLLSIYNTQNLTLRQTVVHRSKMRGVRPQ